MRAFWVRAPGHGEIRPVTLPAARPGRRAGPHPVLRRQPRHRDAGVPRRRAAEPVRRDAGAVPGGRLPRAGQVRLPQRRRRRGGPGRAARPHRLLPVPAPDRLRRAGRRGDRRCPTTCRPPGRCWPAPSRPRSTRCGTPRRCSATGSPWSARAWSAAASRGCWPGSRRCTSSSSTSIPGRADVAAALGRRLRPAGRRRRRARPGRPRQRDGGRAAAVAGAARAGGHRHRAQLVRRPRGAAVAGRRVPLRPARHPRQPGRHRVAGPPRQPHATPTGWRSRWTCCATRPSTRCSPASRRSTSCPR